MNDKYLLSQKPLSDKIHSHLYDYMHVGGWALSGVAADEEIILAKGQGPELIKYKIL